MNSQNVRIIFKDSKSEAVNQKILTTQILTLVIKRITNIYQSPDNILTRVDDKEPLVKTTLKLTNKDLNSENRRIRTAANPKN